MSWELPSAACKLEGEDVCFPEASPQITRATHRAIVGANLDSERLAIQRKPKKSRGISLRLGCWSKPRLGRYFITGFSQLFDGESKAFAREGTAGMKEITRKILCALRALRGENGSPLEVVSLRGAQSLVTLECFFFIFQPQEGFYRVAAKRVAKHAEAIAQDEAGAVTKYLRQMTHFHPSL